MAPYYPTTGVPAGERLSDGPNEQFEPQCASFDGKSIKCAGHVRPVIRENTGSEVLEHFMGIKPPLVQPTVTTDAGLYTGEVQIGVQRVHRASGVRSGISPIYPEGGNAVDSILTATPPGETWDDFDGVRSVYVGGTDTGNIIYGIKQPLVASAVASNIVTYTQSGGKLSKASFYEINAVRFYAYKAFADIAAQTAIGQTPTLSLRVGIYKTSATPYTLVSSPVDVVLSNIPDEGAAPILDVQFTSPVTIPTSEVANYSVIVSLAPATTPNVRAYFFHSNDTSAVGGDLATNDAAGWVDGTGWDLVAADGQPDVRQGQVLSSFYTLSGAGYTPVNSALSGSAFARGIAIDGSERFYVPSLDSALRRSVLRVDSTDFSVYTEGTKTGQCAGLSFFLDPADDTKLYMLWIEGSTLYVRELTDMAQTDEATFALTPPSGFGSGVVACCDRLGEYLVIRYESVTSPGTFAYRIWASGATFMDWTQTGFTASGGSVTAITGIASKPTDPTVVLIAGTGGVDRSTNSAGAFSATVITAQSVAAVYFESSTNAYAIYASTAVANYLARKSTDAGATWASAVAAAGKAAGAFAVQPLIAVAPTDTNKVYAIAAGSLYRSTNAGTSYSRFRASFSYSALAVSTTDADSVMATSTASSFQFRYTGFTDEFGRPVYAYASQWDSSAGVILPTPTIPNPDLYMRLTRRVTAGSAARVASYLKCSARSITVDTSAMYDAEPESIAQGGTERFDAYAVLFRDVVIGPEWREVAIVDAGGSYTFAQDQKSLLACIPYVTEFYECPGSFEDVETFRNQGTERLCFISQPGYDYFEGIPGANDYDARVLDPVYYRKNSLSLLLGSRIGVLASAPSGGALTINVDGGGAISLAAGDTIQHLTPDGATGGTLLILTINENSPGVYDATYLALGGVEPVATSIIYNSYGAIQTIGSVLTVTDPSPEPDWTAYTQVELEITNQALFASSSAGAFVVFVSPDASQASYAAVYQDEAQADSLLYLTADIVGTVPDADWSVRFGFSALDPNAIYRAMAFRDAQGNVTARAFLRPDPDRPGIMQVLSERVVVNQDGTEDYTLGTRGPSPVNPASVESRPILFGSVSKGSSRVQLFNFAEFDDWVQQREVTFEGDTYRGTIKKVLKFDPNTGDLLDPPQLELFEAWDGESHAFVPVTIAGDYGSVHFGGATPETYEIISGLTKFDLKPRSRTRIIKATRETMYVLCAQDEYFEVLPSNFLIPATVAEFNNVFGDISAQVQSTRGSSSFTCSSLSCAVDEDNRIYFCSPQGIVRFNFQGAELLPGMRDRFSKIHWTFYPRMVVAMDGGLFPLPALRVGNIGYAENEATQTMAYVLPLNKWVSMADLAYVEAMCPALAVNGEQRVVFAGKGKLGVFGVNTRREDYTDYDAEEQDAIRNTPQAGQYLGAVYNGFLTRADITTTAWDDVYEMSLKNADDTRADLSGWGTVFNTPRNPTTGQPVLAARSRVSIAIFDVETGAVQQADIIGVNYDADDSDAPSRVYIYKPGGFAAAAGTTSYHWILGAVQSTLHTPEMRPANGATALTIKRIQMDVEPDGTAEGPWWLEIEFYGARTGGRTNTKAALVQTRTVPWTRFKNDSRMSLNFLLPSCRSISTRIKAYAPAGNALRIKDVEITYDDFVR